MFDFWCPCLNALPEWWDQWQWREWPWPDWRGGWVLSWNYWWCNIGGLPFATFICMMFQAGSSQNGRSTWNDEDDMLWQIPWDCRKWLVCQDEIDWTCLNYFFLWMSCAASASRLLGNDLNRIKQNLQARWKVYSYKWHKWHKPCEFPAFL